MEKFTNIVGGSGEEEGGAHKAAEDGGGRWAEHRPVEPEQLRTYLRVIMRTDPIDEEATKHAYGELRAIAAKAGPYLTASEMMQTLGRFPTADQWGNPYRKYLGYEMASSLMLHHIQREIHAIEALNRPLGPRILQDYCKEFMDAVFSAGHVRYGFESLIAVVEDLVVRAVRSQAQRKVYLELAHAIGTVMLETANMKAEQEFQQMARAMRAYKKGDTPKPEKRNRYLVAEETLVEHLQAFAEQIKRLQDEIGAIQAPLPKAPNQQDGHELPPEVAKQQLAFYKHLTPIVDRAGYKPIAGYMKRQAGVLLEGLQKGQGVQVLRAAAADFESQGDHERSGYFVRLSDRRYKDAIRLYEAAGDKAGAQRCREKEADKPPVERPTAVSEPVGASTDRSSRHSRP